MEKVLLLAVSFGTTHKGTCEKNIGAVEERLQEAFPETEVRRAITSGMIREAMRKRGIEVDDVPTALEKAVSEGYDRVIIQPTHLLYGDEYEKMCEQTEFYKNSFKRFEIAKPLLADTCDLQSVAKTIIETYPQEDGCAYVLMGHGTEHYVNPVYAAMQTVFRIMGREDIYVGTVEAWPGIEEIKGQLGNRYTEAVIMPLMLVAGEHAVNDMAGEEGGSWKKQLEEKGIHVTAELRGLGEYEGIREIYVRHTREAMENE